MVPRQEVRIRLASRFPIGFAFGLAAGGILAGAVMTLGGSPGPGPRIGFAPPPDGPSVPLPGTDSPDPPGDAPGDDGPLPRPGSSPPRGPGPEPGAAREPDPAGPPPPEPAPPVAPAKRLGTARGSNDPAAAVLADCAGKARSLAPEEATPARLRALLDSPDPDERRVALGAAARGGTSLAPVLRRIVEDPSHGPLRAAALLALSRVRPPDDGLPGRVLAALDDDDPAVVRTAAGLLHRIGEEGMRRAATLLRSGDAAAEIVPALAAALVDGGGAVAFLESRPPPAAALAVLAAFQARRGLGPEGEVLASRLPGILLPLLPTVEMVGAGRPSLDLAARLGLAGFLRQVALSPDLPSPVRLDALDAAAGNAATAGEGADALAALLAGTGVPAALLREGIARVPPEEESFARFAGPLRVLADGHPSAHVRDEARERLDRISPAHAGDLVVLSARYGTGSHWVDVTRELNARIAAGRLRVKAANEIAGDPCVGWIKDLIVRYRFKGREADARAREGRWLEIP